MKGHEILCQKTVRNCVHFYLQPPVHLEICVQFKSNKNKKISKLFLCIRKRFTSLCFHSLSACHIFFSRCRAKALYEIESTFCHFLAKELFQGSERFISLLIYLSHFFFYQRDGQPSLTTDSIFFCSLSLDFSKKGRGQR